MRMGQNLMAKVMWKLRLLARHKPDFRSLVFLLVDTPSRYITALPHYQVALIITLHAPCSLSRVACTGRAAASSEDNTACCLAVSFSRPQVVLPSHSQCRSTKETHHLVPAWRHHERVLHPTTRHPRHQAK